MHPRVLHPGRAAGLAGPLAALLAVPALLRAQTTPATTSPAAAAALDVPATIDACYVPASGTLYRIDTPTAPAPGAPKACLSATHVKFTWNQQGLAGPAGPKGDKGDPGSGGPGGPDLALAGKLDVSKTGRFGGGMLATDSAALDLPSGRGSRFMWVPQKRAVRAGNVGGTQWDDANVGVGSTAFGRRTMANGAYSVAIGSDNTASGDYSVALGQRASTDDHKGAFVYADASPLAGTLSASVDNQFLVRATGGVRLRTSDDLSKGCDVTGEGVLSCSGGIRAGGESIKYETHPGRILSPGIGFTDRVVCPVNYGVIGGGLSVSGESSAELASVILASYPDTTANAWVVSYLNSITLASELRDVKFVVHAVCLRK